MLLTSILLVFCYLLKIASYGYYNAFGMTATIAINLVILLLKVILTLILSQWSLNFSLKTQVLTQGRVLLTAYDSFGSEALRFKLQGIPTTEDQPDYIKVIQRREI